MRTPAHEATTAQLGAVYPCSTTRQLPGDGILVGRDLFGGSFVHDPFALYRAGTVTNPNMLVLGQIGRGKSAFVKSYLYRQAAIGRRLVVLDPKGEYGPLGRALGVEPVCLRPGGSVRLNPFELGVPAGDRAAGQAEIELVTDLASSCLGRPLKPAEHAAVELAVTSVRESATTPTLDGVVAALLDPERDAARVIAATVASLRADGRDVGLELRRFVSGELSGMFDGPTRGVDLAGAVVVVDLSAVYHSTAIGAVVACVAAALRRAVEARASSFAPSFLVVDEAWAVLQHEGAGRFLQSSFKLARQRGVANIVVAHRPSDFSGAGSRGSVSERLAEGLLSDCETLVCYAQADGELAGARHLLGLSPPQARLVTRLRRGVALWKVAGRPFLVEHRLSLVERQLVDTDAALVDSEGE